MDEAVPGSPWRVISAAELRGGRLPRGMLWAKLQRMESTLLLIQARLEPASADERAFLERLLERLEMARDSLSRQSKGREGVARPRRMVNSTLFWSLVHEVGADMLLLMPVDMLAAEALEVESQFKLNMTRPEVREVWLGADEHSGPLPLAVRQVEALSKHPEPLGPEDSLKLTHARYVLRAVRRRVNEHVDLGFQRLNLTMLVKGMSGILLVLLFVLAFIFNRAVWLTPPTEDETLWVTLARLLPLVLLGAGGAIVANMTSELPALVANGPRWRQFLFYLFVRPAIGAFTAFVFYLLARSRLLFSIEAVDSLLSEQDVPPPIRIVLGSKGAVSFTYAIIAVMVGYYAERVLGSAMDSVLDRLFNKAEKTAPTPLDMQPPAPKARPGSSRSGV